MSGMNELIDAVEVAINACKSVTELGRIAAGADPVRLFAELQAHLEEALWLAGHTDREGAE
jgi:hypothetical protein